MVDYDEEFREIVQEAIAKAEKVRCPMADFRRGLRTMLEELEMRLECEDFNEEEDEETSG